MAHDLRALHRRRRRRRRRLLPGQARLPRSRCAPAGLRGLSAALGYSPAGAAAAHRGQPSLGWKIRSHLDDEPRGGALPPISTSRAAQVCRGPGATVRAVRRPRARRSRLVVTLPLAAAVAREGVHGGDSRRPPAAGDRDTSGGPARVPSEDPSWSPRGCCSSPRLEPWAPARRATPGEVNVEVSPAGAHRPPAWPRSSAPPMDRGLRTVRSTALRARLPPPLRALATHADRPTRAPRRASTSAAGEGVRSETVEFRVASPCKGASALRSRSSARSAPDLSLRPTTSPGWKACAPGPDGGQSCSPNHSPTGGNISERPHVREPRSDEHSGEPGCAAAARAVEEWMPGHRGHEAPA